MSDGFNDARTLRVIELIGDFADIQGALSQIDDQCHPEDYNQPGYRILRQCRIDGFNLLEMHQSTSPLDAPSASPEVAKSQLLRILLDASARRFRAEKICRQATAATRWVNVRNSILKGQRPHVGHAYQLMHCDQALENEMATITDNSLYNNLRQKDIVRGFWINEDPALHNIQAWIAEHC